MVWTIGQIGGGDSITQYQANLVIPHNATETITEVYIGGVSCAIASQVVGTSVTVESVPGTLPDGEVRIEIWSASDNGERSVQYTKTHPIKLPKPGFYDSNSILSATSTSFPDATYITIPRHSDSSQLQLKSTYEWESINPELLAKDVGGYLDFSGSDDASFQVLYQDGTTENVQLSMVAPTTGENFINPGQPPYRLASQVVSMAWKPFAVPVDVPQTSYSVVSTSSVKVAAPNLSYGRTYDLQFRRAEDGLVLVDLQWLTEDETVNGLQEGADYEFRCRYANPKGNGPWSDWVSLSNILMWQLVDDERMPRHKDMRLIYPQSDEVTSSYAWHRAAHPNMEYRVPLRVSFGSWPYRFQIIQDDTGSATLGELLTTGDDYSWLKVPSGVMQQGQSYTFRVRVYDQDYNRAENPSEPLDIEWTATCDANGFVFATPGATASGTGTFSSPFVTNNPTSITEPSKRLILRSGTYTLAASYYSETNPRVMAAYPGESVTVDMDSRCYVSFSSYHNDGAFIDIRFINSRRTSYSHPGESTNTSWGGMFTIWECQRMMWEGCSFEVVRAGQNGTNSGCIRSTVRAAKRHWCISNCTYANSNDMAIYNCYHMVDYLVENCLIQNWRQLKGEDNPQVFLLKSDNKIATYRRITVLDGSSATRGIIHNFNQAQEWATDELEFVWNRIYGNPAHQAIQMRYTQGMTGKNAANSVVLPYVEKFWSSRNSVVGQIAASENRVYNKAVDGVMVEGADLYEAHITKNLIVVNSGLGFTSTSAQARTIVHDGNVSFTPDQSPLNSQCKLDPAHPLYGKVGADLGGIYVGL